MNKIQKPIRLKLKEVVEIEMDGHFILINRNDLYIFASYSWFVMNGKGQTNYLMTNAIVNGKKRTIGYHQLMFDTENGYEVDHINRNGLDNRRENLRLVTHQQNQSNLPKKSGSMSKYYGVSFCKRDKVWQCGATYKGKRKNIGRFSSEIEAAVAYNNYLILNNIPKAMNNV